MFDLHPTTDSIAAAVAGGLELISCVVVRSICGKFNRIKPKTRNKAKRFSCDTRQKLKVKLPNYSTVEDRYKPTLIGTDYEMLIMASNSAPGKKFSSSDEITERVNISSEEHKAHYTTQET